MHCCSPDRETERLRGVASRSGKAWLPRQPQGCVATARRSFVKQMEQAGGYIEVAGPPDSFHTFGQLVRTCLTHYQRRWDHELPYAGFRFEMSLQARETLHAPAAVHEMHYVGAAEVELGGQRGVSEKHSELKGLESAHKARLQMFPSVIKDCHSLR